MKIIFLCGSVEPNKDGVGDYTRRLSGELVRSGHDVQIVSLCDHQVAFFTVENQLTENTKILVHRIPEIALNHKRFVCSQEILNTFQPDWVSLQYVPFSFNPKGLPFWLPSFLKKLKGNHKWHIMFHELWVGMDQEAPLKHKIWGNLQQYIARKTIRKIVANNIHTQSRLYQSQLEKIGCKASYLPLFGNIAVIENKVSSIQSVKDSLDFTVFGTIHHNAPVREFISELAEYGRMNKLKIKLNFIGRCGGELNHWIAVCKEQRIVAKVLGEQDTATISKVLSDADWGISTTPWRQIEKSGTVAAMLEHGLNVICVARPWTPDKDMPSSTINGIAEYKENSLGTLLNFSHPHDSKIILKNIADSFIGALDCQ